MTMMSPKLIPLFLSLYLANGKGTGLKRKPYGPCMCIQVCSQLGLCVYPKYSTDDLTCYLSNITETEMMAHDTINVLNMVKKINKAGRKGTLVDTGRFITSRKGLSVFVQTDEKVKPSEAVNERKKTSHPKRVIFTNILKNQFTINMPTILKKLRCSLKSMTASRTHKNTLYLLVQCMDVVRCYRRLHFVDLRTKTMLNKTIDFCEKQAGERQLSSGPCIRNSSENCLYSTNNGDRLRITTYKEPSIKTKKLKIDVANFALRLQIHTLFCTVVQTKHIVCLKNGEMFERVWLYLDVVHLQMYSMQWKFERFSDIKDFIIVKDTMMHYAVFLEKSLITVVALDFERRKFIKPKTDRLKAVTVTATNGYIFLHGRSLEEPFHRLKLH